MDLTPMHKRVLALDVHQAKITACAVVEHDDGRVQVTKRDFGAFKRDRRALAQWALQIAPEVVVMESTGVYWKSPFAALEAVGIIAWVVNARHVKAVPGRKTDMADAQWLATLARAGLLRASFIPPQLMRQLRLVARQRQKLVGMCSAEKNRLHKVLVDAGIRLNVLVSDIHGSSARAMIKALIVGQPMHEVLDHKGRLRASRDELFEALCTEQFSAAHRFVADEIMQHIESLERRIAGFDRYLLEGLRPWRAQLTLLQTIPGIDEQGAAMLLVEIGADMSVFGSAERLASWVGICPGNNESAGKRKCGRIRKGNAWVRRLLCEFSQAAARTRCALKAKFDALTIRKGRKKSIIALAHKMLRTIYAMLTHGTHYRDKEVDYEALNVERNAPRWMKMLLKHGFITNPAAAAA
ncbi:transposase and inactivated derivatives [Serpentinimonas raichei]|uniref:Transposase and inactivated derivatives n=1 Tax=Serpentinimonas raichei TaxID=1458425 RepID=A0A060NJI0_9BURK|nr:IS110 family transposase [Serpentinimonas raichei]BAO80236.1 transposase and inactivated derivatives [Serpentinimonas raichei]BAO80726.1 transposase and inactivated derivatives [Serpentinimonas raichei]BAO81300.1 transposase and inactivated derivatives [Serpentinimonas raichei]BAO81638.1 transposase and inactivated derivatives [Serpentinimonas raichei]BAO82047.1 transposase and inactivated derivatives [Serpentinimonas raichei]